MLSDLYTYIIGYVTPRTNGCKGGDFLVAGPEWAGSTPAGITGVFHSPTQFALAFFRTQLFGPDDLPAVWRIQDQFKVQTLSSYRGSPAPAAAPAPAWIAPLDVRKEPTSLRFFAILNWMLQYMPPLEDERGVTQPVGNHRRPAWAATLPSQTRRRAQRWWRGCRPVCRRWSHSWARSNLPASFSAAGSISATGTSTVLSAQWRHPGQLRRGVPGHRLSKRRRRPAL